MPPRASRGARGAAGRGRVARAGASAAAGTSRAPAAAEAADEGSAGAPPPEQSTPAPANPAPAPAAATPPVTVSSSSSSSAAAAAAPPPRPAGGSRFKPKNVRRDAAERKRLEDERNKDLAVKIKAEERELRAEERRARRGGGGGGRGRGDAMSQRGMMRRTVTASGPFSAIPTENVKTDGNGGGWNGFSRGGGGGGGRGGARLGDIPHHNNNRYRPRREHESRVNIDLLNGEDAEEGDDPLALLRSGSGSKGSGALPVGLFRQEHEEEEVKVATTAELEAEEQQSDGEDEQLFVEQQSPAAAEVEHRVGIQDDNEVWHAAPAGAVKVKPEPGSEEDAMDVDMADIPPAASAAGKAPEESPEQKKKDVTHHVAVSKEKEKRREKAMQDPEVQHALYDTQTLLRELRLHKPEAKEGGEGAEGEGEGEEEQGGQEKDGRLYLFQLPPILPPLAKPADPSEQDGADEGGAGAKPDQPGSGGGAQIKTEEGAEAGATSSSVPLPEGGCIGKLNVRRSGRVELDWGGTVLTLGMGTDTDFLTTALMMETKEHPDNPEAVTGVASSMGQIMGNFVLTPVWDEEEDWDPSLDDLELGEEA